MPSPGFAAALAGLRDGVDVDLSALLAAAVAPLGGREVVAYLVDFGQQVLFPLQTDLTDPLPAEEAVATTMAGRAFATGQPVTAERPGGVRVWVPLVEGSDRTGVLAVTLPAADDATLAELELVGMFAGLLVATTARFSDLPHLRRRGRTMGLAATLQWDLLPPLCARTPRVLVAGLLEPAYDIAGDGFDYAVNGDEVQFAVFDGMGHGVTSSLLTGLAVGAYRHARRQHAELPEVHARIERSLSAEYGGEAFVTGVVGRLALATGQLDWSNAGHPAPLLLRDRQVVAELAAEPGLPFGLGSPVPAAGRRRLQPGDAVLLYTDGVVEARTRSGEPFGLDRLVDLLEREAATDQPAEELLRRLVRAVLDHGVGRLRDDATLVLVHWQGEPSVASALPGQRGRALADPEPDPVVG